MKSIKDRLLAKITINERTGCWEWMAAKCKNGYGQFSVEGRTRKSHRVSYEIHFGRIPDGLQVLHCCDNTGCINPDHLFLGNNNDNVADKMRKGRHNCARGAGHALSKLTEDDVVRIRSASGTRLEIAERFGVSCPTVSQIISRKTWKHL